MKSPIYCVFDVKWTFLIAIFYFVSAGFCYSQNRSIDSLKTIYKMYPDTAQKLQAILSFNHSIPLIEFDSRISVSNAGIQLATVVKDSLMMGEFYTIKGSSFYFKGKFDSAAHYYYKAIDILEIKPHKKQLAFTLNNLAKLYRKKSEFPRALNTYERAMNIYKELGDLEGIATIYNESGVVYEYMNDFEEAERRYKASLNIQIQRNDSVGISYAYSNIGYLYISLNTFKLAEEYLMKALNIRKALKDSFALALNYNELGELYLKSGQYSKGTEYLSLSIFLAEPNAYMDLLMDNYKKRSEAYAASGNFKSAYADFQTFHILKDSIYKVDVAARIEEVSTQYETDKKEAENELLKRIVDVRDLEIQNQVNQNRIQSLTFFSMGILLVFGVVVGLFIFFRALREQQIRMDSEIGNAREAERRRISRDLHDNLGTQMSYLITLLDKTSVNETEKPLINAMRETAGQAIMTLRETVWAINLKEISIENFSDKFKQYALKQTEVLNGIEVIFKENIEENRLLGPSVALNLFRLFQEAFSNALKHSNAMKIQVIFRSDAIYRFYFSVEDNGNGFDTQSSEKAGHYGLENMKLRAEESGAQYRILSQKGEGTKVEVFSPMGKQKTQ